MVVPCPAHPAVQFVGPPKSGASIMVRPRIQPFALLRACQTLDALVFRIFDPCEAATAAVQLLAVLQKGEFGPPRATSKKFWGAIALGAVPRASAKYVFAKAWAKVWPPSVVM